MSDKKTERRSRHVTGGTWREESGLGCCLCQETPGTPYFYYYFKCHFGDSRKKNTYTTILCTRKVEVGSITKESLKRVQYARSMTTTANGEWWVELLSIV